MANVTINPGAVQLGLTNLSTQTIVTAYRTLTPGQSGTVAANRIVGNYHRALELSTFITNGILSVTYNGVALTAGQLLQLDAVMGILPAFTDGTRPAAATAGSGADIWNTGDASTNVSNGTNWYDPDGNIT